VAIQQVVAQDQAPVVIEPPPPLPRLIVKPPVDADATEIDWAAITGPTWERVRYSITRTNPAAARPGQPLIREDLSVQARVELTDAPRILGYDTTPRGVKVVVEGADVTEQIIGDHRPGGRRSFRPPRYDENYIIDQEQHWVVRTIRPIRMDVRLNPGATPPTHIDRIEGYYLAAVAERIEHVDVPFVAGGE
jgi:chloramphenicol 3-O-phosphotransferase